MTRRLTSLVPTPPRRARLATASVAFAALVGGLLVSGVHDAYPTTRVLQTSGLAWVASDQIGSLTLLDGVAGQPVVDVPAAQADGDALLAGQDGTTGFALDQASGLLTRVDGSSYAATSAVGPPPGTKIGTGTAVRFLVGTHTAYVVDEADGAVSAYDLATLLQVGARLPFRRGASSDPAVVDSSDRLWILDQSTGRLTWFTGKATGHSAAVFTPGAASLILAAGEPVVVDTGTRRASLIAPDGSVRTQLALGADSVDPGASYSGATAQQVLLITDSERGTYQSCTLTLGTCGASLHAGFGGDTLGPAVTADARAFVPDYTTGTAWVLDPSGALPAVHTGTLTAAGTFDLFDRNGLIFYNDPRTSQAGTVAPDGTARPIAKYSSATTAGTPPVSASATTAATPGVSALPSPTSARPTHSAPRPTTTVARSSGAPVPVPSPSNSGGGATYCAVSTSGSPQAVSEQGGIPLSNTEKSAAEKSAPDGFDQQPSAMRIAIVTAVVGGVIAGIFGLLDVWAPNVLFSKPQDPGSSSASAVRSGSPAPPSASSAADASMPANPEFTLQDPWGKGVYGVAFISNSTLATGDLVGKGYLWDLNDATNTKVLPDQSGQGIYGLAYDPQDGILAASTSNSSYSAGSAVLWNASTGRYITTLVNPDDTGVGSLLAFSPDGGTLAVGDDNGYVYLWSTTTFQRIGDAIADPGTQGPRHIAYSPKTGYLAVADGNGRTYLWDTHDSKIVGIFPDPNSQGLNNAVFSPDGSVLATGDGNGNVYLWNVADNALITTLYGLKGGYVLSIAFSPDRPVLAATLKNKETHTSEFCVWNTAGKVLAVRHDSGGFAGTQIAFSPDGNTLAVGDENNYTYIWNASGLS
jgi:WD domain, G-beta repeat